MSNPTYEELAAQVEVLKQVFSELVGNANTDANEFSQVIISKIDFDAVHKCFESTPAVCLAQVRADAGRAGYIAGTKHSDNVFFFDATPDINIAAKEYAECIRQEVQNER